MPQNMNSSLRHAFFVAVLLASVATLADAADLGVRGTRTGVDDADCMEELWNAAGNNQGLVCNAMEVTAFMVSNVMVVEACAFAGDTAEITFDVGLELNAMSMNPARYDIGIYVAQDGGDALTGTCRVETPKAPPAADVDNDACGDINQAVEPFMYTMSNVEVLCIDEDGDGFLDLTICTAWKQIDSQCDGPLEAIPGTPAKCNCVDDFDWGVLIPPGQCGDGIINPPDETCDPPGAPAGGNGNDCRNDCTVCGDAIVDGNEECDDGNGVDNDGCSNDCTGDLPFCGDGEINLPDETCDPPDAPGGGNGNLCRDDCTVCGDTVLDFGEQCDDGNGVDHDGCDNDCTNSRGACCSDGPGTASECLDGLTEDECVSIGGTFVGNGVDCSEVDDCSMLFVAYESMSAKLTPRGVVIEWVTSAEIDTIGFRVLRAVAGGREKRAPEVAFDFIPAKGQSIEGATYEILDNSHAARRARHYWLEDIDIYGKITRHGPIVVERGRRGSAPRDER